MNRFILALSLVAFSEVGVGQDATCTTSAHFLGERANNVVCQPFVVDMTTKPVRVPKAVHVPNEVPLTVTVRHVINQTCSVNFKAASIASSVNPLAGLLGTMVGLKVPTNYTAEIMFNELEKAGCFMKISAPPTDAKAHQINNDLQKLDELLIEKGAKLDTLAKEFDTSDVVSDIKNLAFCIPSTDCATDSAFEAKKAKLSQDIQNLQSELDLTPILQERTRLKQAFGNWQDANKGKETTWQGEVDAFFRCFDDKLKAVHSTSKTLKAQLDKLSDGLKKLSRTLDDTYVLPLYRNSKVTTDVVCSDKDSKASAGAPTDPKTAAATTPPSRKSLSRDRVRGFIRPSLLRTTTYQRIGLPQPRSILAATERPYACRRTSIKRRRVDPDSQPD